MKPILARLLGRVILRPDGCWEYAARRNNSGYGMLNHENRAWVAHRLSYTLLVGSIPDGLELDHLCRNRACVNPEHLEPVTHAENVRRGLSPQQIRDRAAARTHCVNGHAFDAANTYVTPKGARQCRRCKANTMARLTAAKRSAA